MLAEWPPSAYTEGSFVTGKLCDLPHPGRMAPFRYDFADRIYCSHSVYSAMLAEWSLLTAADGMPTHTGLKPVPGSGSRPNLNWFQGSRLGPGPGSWFQSSPPKGRMQTYGSSKPSEVWRSLSTQCSILLVCPLLCHPLFVRSARC